MLHSTQQCLSHHLPQCSDSTDSHLPSLRMCSLTDQSENTYTEHRNTHSLINQSRLSCRKAVRHGLVGCLDFCICVERAHGDHQLQPSQQRVFPSSYNSLYCLYQTFPPISPPIYQLDFTLISTSLSGASCIPIVQL